MIVTITLNVVVQARPLECAKYIMEELFLAQRIQSTRMVKSPHSNRFSPS